MAVDEKGKRHVLMHGKTADGRFVPICVNPAGAICSITNAVLTIADGVTSFVPSGDATDKVQYSKLPNRSAITFKGVTVVTAGTPVQGPDVPIPHGYTLAIRNRVTNPGTPIVYVANNAANTSNPAERNELGKGDVERFNITNMNLLWFDATANGIIAELVAEQ